MAEARGVLRYLPTPVRSAIGIAALGAIVTGAAVQRRRRRAAAKDPTVWATSGSTGKRRAD
ncbi:hypothetical protein [uncultured Jatrophihabitans sp.]|uniref:hypothetical protein n=1 Tax=uncultured Jatrophihabitans sp. TaxID=1610747 RepID=UPI0035C9BDDA